MEMTLFLLPFTFTLLRPCLCTLYTIRPQQRLTVTPLMTLTFNLQSAPGGLARCAATCKSTSDCVSVNVMWDSGTSSLTCELQTSYLHEAPGSLTSLAEWSFVQEDPVYTDSSWALAFRVTAAVGHSAYEDFLDDGRHDDKLDMAACARVSSSLPCGSHFRSYILDRWTNIDEVRVQLHKDGSVAHELTFDGQGSTRLSWLQQSRVLTSTWTDLATASTNFFSVEGDSTVLRRFYMNHNFDGCPNDHGWLFVSDYRADYNMLRHCDYEVGMDMSTLPVIFYSPESDRCNWQHYYAADQRAMADFMTIHVTFSTAS